MLVTSCLSLTEKMRRVEEVSHFNLQRAGAGGGLAVLHQKDLHSKPSGISLSALSEVTSSASSKLKGAMTEGGYQAGYY